MTRPPSVTVFAPGTVGNMICGFDVLGLALESPGDRVVATLRDEPGVEIRTITGDGGRIPRDPERNSAGVAAAALLEIADSDVGVELELHKGLPLSGGMGGSAASAVAAAVAADALLERDTSPEDLLECALAGEAVASGSAHADNIGPSLQGGIVLARTGARRSLVRLPVPEGLSVAVLHPWIELRTSDARAVLPSSVPLDVGAAQWGDTAALVAGLYEEDWDLIADALTDRIAEPVRADRVPGFAAMRAAALDAGAVGFGISGAGPSVVGFCRSPADARQVGEAMTVEFTRHSDAETDLHVSPVGAEGARIVEGSRVEVG